MAEEKKLSLAGETYYYIKENTQIIIKKVESKSSSIKVPAYIEGLPVLKIGKKCFLSCRYLKQLVIPEPVSQIDDWCLAGCKELTHVSFLNQQIVLGQNIFRGDEKLREICFGNRTDMAQILGNAVSVMGAEYLLHLFQENDASFFKSYDERIKSFLKLPMEEVFRDLVYCAEEDMGEKQEEQERAECLKRVRSSYIRLQNDRLADADTRKLLGDYIDEHLEPRNREESLEAILLEGQNAFAWMDILYSIIKGNREKVAYLLQRLDWRNTELKGYLMKKEMAEENEEENTKNEAFFEELKL